MKIENTNGQFVAKGYINGNFVIGMGRDNYSAFVDAVDEYQNYISKFLGNIPFGYNSEGGLLTDEPL